MCGVSSQGGKVGKGELLMLPNVFFAADFAISRCCW